MRRTLSLSRNPSPKCCDSTARVARFFSSAIILFVAAVAQLVERNLAKVEVESSRLFCRSKFQNKEYDTEPTTVPFLFVARLNEPPRVRRVSKEVMQRIANPSRAVRFRYPPPPYPLIVALTNNVFHVDLSAKLSWRWLAKIAPLNHPATFGLSVAFFRGDDGNFQGTETGLVDKFAMGCVWLALTQR
jgi:hypothetical protein